MPFLGAQAEKNRCCVKRQVNREKEGENADNPERNRLREYTPCGENREKRNELHDCRQHKRPADFFGDDFVAPVHGVHAKRCSACESYVEHDGGQKDDCPDNGCNVKHVPKIKKWAR